MKKLLALLCIGLMCADINAQKEGLLERMGYSPSDKLLIVHADDLGVAHSVNMASIEAFEKGGISSASIMVPCPWFPHIALYAKDHPEYCWGIHLTLTAEWAHYKWDGVSSSDAISSLLNEDRMMYDNVAEVIKNQKLQEVESELRAQIERAIRHGVSLSHLDSHMGTLFQTEELFKLYLRLGNEYKLPILMPYHLIPKEWNIDDLIGPFQVPVNSISMLNEGYESVQEAYDGFLKQMKPGINELIIHLGISNEELREVTVDHPAFGAAWRQNDLDYVLSDHFKRQLTENNIKVISWREIRNAMEE